MENNFTFGYAGYARAMKSTNATSVLMFNVVRDDPEKSVARIKSRLPQLVGVDWIELGNEVYDENQGVGLCNHSGATIASNYITLTKQVAATWSSS